MTDVHPPQLPALRVGTPRMPTLEALMDGLSAIVDAGWLTNGGPIHNELERRLRGALGAQEVLVTNSGTSALQLVCQGLQLTGDVVTTPFTFPATVNALVLSGLRPVFADVDDATLMLDPAAVEAAITPATTAILAVHLFGGAADVEALEAVAKRNGVRLLFDAAHAFGVTVAGRPVGGCGDGSAFSFHATKIFHTLEGGAVTCDSAAVAARIARLRNHGLDASGWYAEPGTNAKLNEIQALIGLELLDGVPAEIAGRRRVDGQYRAAIAGAAGIRALPLCPGVEHNHSYFPVRVVDGSAETLVATLAADRVHARRYFQQPCHRVGSAAFRLPAGSMPIAECAGATTVCLPIDARMPDVEVERVCEVLDGL